MVHQLIKNYKEIFESKKHLPEWAVHKIAPCGELVHCPIPFVGKDYSNQKVKILLYASAENLSKYHLLDEGYLDDDDYAINRHRSFFDASFSKPGTFYQNVHIQPITDGGLALVAFYIFCRLADAEDIKPAEFLEKISFSNYCKYTIGGIASKSGKSNIDYANKAEYLSHSHSYVEKDIEILRPDYIIMPKTIYNTDRQFIDAVKGDAKIIPIYQINAKNINMRITDFPPRSPGELLPPLYDWWNHLADGVLKGKTQMNFLSVFSYVDYVMENEIV